MAKLVALKLTDDDLDRLAEITESDILKTQQAWEKSVKPKHKNLLLAEDQNANRS